MGYYQPRPTEGRICKHCAQPFQTAHKRAIYCKNSCRVMAHQARQGPKRQEVTVAEDKGELKFSVQNVGTTSVGAGVAALGNYLLNDQPAHQRLLARLDQLDQNTQRRFNKIDQAIQFIIDNFNALRAENPAMSAAFERLQAARLNQQAKPAEKPNYFQKLWEEAQAKKPDKPADGS